MSVQFGRQSTLQPGQLQLSAGQHLADVIMKFATQALPLGFLNIQHSLRQFLRLQLNQAAGAPKIETDTGKGDQVERQQACRKIRRADTQHRIAQRCTGTERRCDPLDPVGRIKNRPERLDDGIHIDSRH
ncbi:hypothetical protein, partial [Pseudomonas viridiflava]|uniref:hypothetical protein n=1 Tax=Pseudomonas viridiflava TaxID=33069 RepID=UPI00197EF0B2